MNPEFIRAALRDNPALFRWIQQFNQSPAASLHPDHRPADLPAPLFETLVASSRGRRQLSDWLVRSRKLAPEGCWGFDQPPRRVALLGPAALDRLVLLAGAALRQQQIAGLIEGSRIREIKEFLGEPVYQFAVKRASLLMGSRRDVTVPAASDDLRGDITASGRRCLTACVAGAPAELIRRFQLRLPATFDLSAAGISDGEREQTWQRLRRIIRSEFEPDVSACFN